MNNADHISGSLEKTFWVNILKLFDADPGSGMENFRIWRINIPDPQHCSVKRMLFRKYNIFLPVLENTWKTPLGNKEICKKMLFKVGCRYFLRRNQEDSFELVAALG
jgi:hypothetical protein